MDPMQQAEEELKAEEEKKRKLSGPNIYDLKRQRMTEDSNIASKETLGDFIVADRFTGAKEGYVFKMGSRGLGYYEDADLRTLKAKRMAEEKGTAIPAGENPEEIDLDLDDDEDDGGRPSNANPEEIDLEDIQVAPVPARVLGGLQDFKGGGDDAPAPLADEVPEEEPGEEAEPEAAQPKGALAKFQRHRKGKGF